ncbi:MAG: hypothetical protein OXH00_22535 [Candidatus Poribacteria bacterium]|nr:hypothetical protein [Candidatus Poribacteria bacterium]
MSKLYTPLTDSRLLIVDRPFPIPFKRESTEAFSFPFFALIFTETQ